MSNEKVAEEEVSGERKRNYSTIMTEQNIVEENIKKKKTLPELIPAFGILMAILNVLFFSIESVIAKVLTQFHAIEVLAIRTGFQFLFFTTITIFNKNPIFGESGQRIDLALRGIYGMISMGSIYMAYRLIPLADATTIYFSTPVFVTIFAYFILKDPLTIVQVITGTVTIIGVIIIAKPEFIFNPNSDTIMNERLGGILLSILSMLTCAMVLITLRKLKTTPVSVVIVWYAFIITISCIVFLIVMDEFIWPTGWYTWTLLISSGIFSVCSNYFMTLALQYESAGPVSVARTLSIVFAFIWDVLLFSESYDWTSILGACLVSVSIIILGVYKWKEEKPEVFEHLKNKFCYSRKFEDDSYLQEFSQPFYDAINRRVEIIIDEK